MKMLRRVLPLLLALCMVLLLGGCSQKVKPEKINTKDFSREIQIEAAGSDGEIVGADKSAQSAQPGQHVKSNDSIRTGTEDMTLLADGSKHIHVEADSQIRLEASGTPESGKTRIHLEQGGVMAALDEVLKQDELFQIQTDSGLISIKSGIVRVSKQGGFTLIEVLEGSAEATILKTGAQASAQAGQALLISTEGKKPAFVLEDELDADSWKSNQSWDEKVGTDGTGSPVLAIPYGKLPDSVLEQMADLEEIGHLLPLSREAVADLLETGHVFEEAERVEPTCTEAGKRTLVCTLCGETEEEALPALGHEEEEIPAEAATCTQDGKTAGIRCSVCGEILKEQETVPALGHEQEELPAEAATCTQDGKTAGARCSVCGEILTEQETVAASGHETEKVPDTAPTCTTDGAIGETHCVICGEVIQPGSVVTTHGHTPEILPAVPATCEDSGLTEGSRCAVCGEILQPQETVPALGHTCETVPGRPSTCEKLGLSEGQRCTVCGKMVKQQQNLPKLAHTKETIPAIAPTCTQDGSTESIRCAVCGAVIKKAEAIPMTGHAPETLPAVPATCEESGLTEGSRCTVCGETLEAQREIPALGHSEETIPGREPTCSEIGLTEGTRCTVCHKVLTRREIIPRLPHTPQVIRGIYAMCYREGLTDGSKCAVCGKILEQQQVIPALPHTRGGLAAVAPTCTSFGWTEGLACRVCSYPIQPQVKIPKLDHTPGSATKEYNPDAVVLDADGNLVSTTEKPAYCYAMVKRCTMCGEICETQRFQHVEGTATVTALGTADSCQKVEVKCADCGQVIRWYFTAHQPGSAVTEIDSEGISWGIVKCAQCGIELSRAKLEP